MSWSKGVRSEDLALIESIVGLKPYAENGEFVIRPPDLTIAPDGAPYIYRWHVIPRGRRANTYLHLQVASDPERPLHDHPWDNCSVILAGGYVERLCDRAPQSYAMAEMSAKMYERRPGDVVRRSAAWPHRIFLPKGVPYSLMLFTTGPVLREWGFWTRHGWVSHHELIENLPDGRSVFKGALVEGDEE